MNGMVDSVPAYDGLAALWEGMSQPLANGERPEATTGSSAVSATTNSVDHDEVRQESLEELILGDEAEDQDDKLIFL
jgi:hypothetical protein